MEASFKPYCLPNHAVDVNTAYLFKARLDQFWMNQDVKYDLTANLTGTGDRSVHEVKHSFTQWCYIDTDQEVFYTCVR